jgi:hypothetical protein
MIYGYIYFDILNSHGIQRKTIIQENLLIDMIITKAYVQIPGKKKYLVGVPNFEINVIIQRNIGYLHLLGSLYS